ncbi:DNA cytosine methyltransferase, partial [bacterium]|nr:DNA cytosine methyltransferase [bacterium]
MPRMDEEVNDEKEITFIEMFCGVGGFRLGLREAGNFKCLWANDNDKYACQIY